MIYRPPEGARVLQPYDAAEAIPPHLAAKQADRTAETIRQWASIYGLGRRIGGRWMLSRIALAMFLEGDFAALRAYHLGQREDSAATAYYARMLKAV